MSIKPPGMSVSAADIGIQGRNHSVGQWRMRFCLSHFVIKYRRYNGEVSDDALEKEN